MVSVSLSITKLGDKEEPGGCQTPALDGVQMHSEQIQESKGSMMRGLGVKRIRLLRDPKESSTTTLPQLPLKTTEGVA